jgi:hypothetical protein
MIGLAHEIPLRGSWSMTGKTTSAKSIDDVDGSSLANLCSIFGYVELEEFPIMRCGAVAPVPLDHGLAWNQLNDRSRWIHGAGCRLGGGQRPVEIALQVVHVELADRCHVRDTPKRRRVDVSGIHETRRKQQCDTAQCGGYAFIPCHGCSSVFVTSCRWWFAQAGCFNAALSIGIFRSRLPVAAKIALATAGTMAEVPHSPIPPGGSELATI